MSRARLSDHIYSVLDRMWVMTSRAVLGWATLQVMIRGLVGRLMLTHRLSSNRA